MNGKRFSESKARRNGFYLALAICLVAVGVAAWSTFDAVQGYMTATSTESSTSSARDDDPEAPRTPVPSGNSSGSAATPVRPAATPTPSPSATPAPARPTPAPSAAPQAEETEPDEQEESPQVPANAPLYEITDEMIYPLSAKEVAKAYSSGAPMYSATMRDWRVHTGTDLIAEPGEQVLACANGRVEQVYTDPMLGNVVVIEHGDYHFSYCGLGEDFTVAVGDVVTIGQAIGTVTAVPMESADEPHLHLEVRRDSAYLDPRSVLEGEN